MANKKRTRIRDDVGFNIVNYTILTVILLIVAYPLIYIVSASFSSTAAVMANRVWLLITLDRSQVDWQKTAPFKMRFDVDGALWCREENPIRTLGKNNVSPGDFGWIIPEECI